jgi:glucose/arabinose dehydrogenase
MRCVWSSTALAAITFALCSSSVWAQPLTAVVSDPGNLTIQLEPVANLSGLIPIDAATIAGDSKLYVGTYIASSASVQIVDPVAKTVSGTPFLTFAGTGVPITGFGLQGITFSPNFNDDSQPGYRKFYTYEVETGPGAGNIMYAHPEKADPGQVGMLREWTANAAGTAIDTSIPSRVVLNFGGPSSYTHNGGGLKFGPDGYLYLSTGDGGGNGNGGSTTSINDGFTGRDADGNGTSNDVPGISNGEDFTNPLGAVVRIDPYVTNADGAPRATPTDATAKEFGGSTRYFIPDSNPFVGNTQNIYFTPLGPASSHAPVAPLGEIFAFGFRNPWKLSFDKNAVPGDSPYVADVGSHDREEIVLLEAGKNYGWPYREGDVASGAATGRPLVDGNVPYLKETSPGVFAQFDLDPTLSDPTQMALPLAVLGTRSVSGGSFYDNPNRDVFNDGIYGDEYGDGDAVVGGFVYRGSAIPALEGMYVLGAYEYVVPVSPGSYVATSAGGRLFYLDPDNASTIREFNFEVGSEIPANGGGNIFSIAEGDDGELYAMFGNGDIKLIAAEILPGDYNGDHAVNAADYTVWRNNLGTTIVLPNDPIGGEISAAQYDQWKNNFGAGDLGTGSLSSVPEPGALSLIMLGLLKWMAPARRRRSVSP